MTPRKQPRKKPRRVVLGRLIKTSEHCHCETHRFVALLEERNQLARNWRELTLVAEVLDEGR